MDEKRFYVSVRKENGNIYDSDKYTTEEMTASEMVEAFEQFVNEHWDD